MLSPFEWNTTEDGKSMKNTLYILRYAKRTLNSGKIKPAVLAVVELHLSEGISR